MAQSRSNRFFNSQQHTKGSGPQRGPAEAFEALGPPAAGEGRGSSISALAHGGGKAGVKAGGNPYGATKDVLKGARTSGKAMQKGEAPGQAAATPNAPQPDKTGGAANRSQIIDAATVATFAAGAIAKGAGAAASGAAKGAAAGAKGVVTMAPAVNPAVTMSGPAATGGGVMPMKAPVAPVSPVATINTSIKPAGPTISPNVKGTPYGSAGTGNIFRTSGLDIGAKKLGTAALDKAKSTVMDKTLGRVGVDSGVIDAFKGGRYGEAAGRTAGNVLQNAKSREKPGGAPPPLPSEGRSSRFSGAEEGTSTKRYRGGSRFGR